MSYLTPFSFEIVKTQLEQASKVQIIQENDATSCLVRSQGQNITSTTDSCPCGFVSAMKLPCKHIFAVRAAKSLSEYEESLCAERWTLQHFSHHRAYLPTDSGGGSDTSEPVSTQPHVSLYTSEPVSTVLSEQQKYRKAFKIAQNLCQQLSTFGMRDFNEGVEVLQLVGHLWEQGKKVFVGEATGMH